MKEVHNDDFDFNSHLLETHKKVVEALEKGIAERFKNICGINFIITEEVPENEIHCFARQSDGTHQKVVIEMKK